MKDIRTYKQPATVVLAFLILVAVPLSAHAFFSILSSVFAQSSMAVEDKYMSNSQTLTLLSPASTTQYLNAYGGGDVSVSDNALLSGGVSAEGAEKDATQGNSLYVVRDGDDLSTISSLFDVSVKTIRLANDISSNGTIHPGDMLEIPPVDGVPYTIEKGDTLSSIASRHNASADAILSANFILDEESLKIDEQIFIPGGEVNERKTAPQSSTRIANRSTNISSGYYIYPLANRAPLSQGYHGRWRGIDWAAPVGTPVIAAASGTVRLVNNSGWGGGYGHYVVISHSNGSQTLYAHNSRNVVSVGDRVEQGQVIGYTGNSGRSTGPHLHFEIRNGIDVPLDL